MGKQPIKRHRGFTLIEILVVVALVVILLTIAAPSMRDLIVKQRLKSVTAELATDLQYARSEAISRQQNVYLKFTNTGAMSCYILYIPTSYDDCDCTRSPGNACIPDVASGGSIEIRTTQVLPSTDVQFVPQSAGLLFFSADGIRTALASDYSILTSRVSGASGQMRITINAMGRPTVCSPDASVTGVPAC